MRRTRPTSSAFAQILVLAAICFCGPGLFNALTSVASGLANPAVAYAGNVVVYLCFASCSLLATLSVGVRPALVGGAAGYALYAATLFNLRVEWISPPLALYYASCAAVGASAGFLWTAQGRIVMSYATQETQGRYLGVFWVIFNLGAACGGLLTFVLNFHASEDTAERSSSAMYGVFLVLMSTGVLLAGFGIVEPGQVVREDGSHVDASRLNASEHEPTAPGSAWRELCRLLARTRLRRATLGLLPLFVYSNWFYTYHSFFNVAVFNARTSGLASACYWLAQMVAAYMSGSGLDRQMKNLAITTATAIAGEKRKASAETPGSNTDVSAVADMAMRALVAFALLANVTWATGWYFQVRSLQLQYDRPLNLDVATDFSECLAPFLLYMLYGCNDALCQVWTYWFMGMLAARDATFCGYLAGVYKGVQAVSAAAAWYIGAVKTSPETQLDLNWLLCNVAMLGALLSVHSFRNTDIEEEKDVQVLLRTLSPASRRSSSPSWAAAPLGSRLEPPILLESASSRA